MSRFPNVLERTSTQAHYLPASVMSTQTEALISHHSAILSRPPSYMRRGSQEENISSQVQHLEILQELSEHYNRQNRREHYMDRLLFWSTVNNSGDQMTEKPKLKYALQSCLSSQFKGTAFLIWTIIFTFVGCISIFIDLPAGAQALWILLALYLLTTLILLMRRRKENARIEELEECIVQERARRRQLVDQVHNLPEGYYFEIQHHNKQHTHPVVTLLPPPPAYPAAVAAAAAAAAS